jgi:hypothetical protein
MIYLLLVEQPVRGHITAVLRLIMGGQAESLPWIVRYQRNAYTTVPSRLDFAGSSRPC